MNPYDGTTYLSSGFIVQGTPNANFQVNVPKAGSFPFLCIIHPGMAGTVTVSDTATPTSQADIDAAAQAAFSAATPALKAEAAKLAQIPVTQRANVDGSTT